MMYVDDHPRLRWSWVLKHESDPRVVFARFLADIDVFVSPSPPGCVRWDNGSELINPDIVGSNDHLGIHRKYTPAGPPKHNDAANRTIAVTLNVAMASYLEPPRLSRDAKFLPTGSLWSEACHYASDVINITAKLNDEPQMLSPYRTFYGRAPSERRLRGCSHLLNGVFATCRQLRIISQRLINIST